MSPAQNFVSSVQNRPPCTLNTPFSNSFLYHGDNTKGANAPNQPFACTGEVFHEDMAKGAARKILHVALRQIQGKFQNDRLGMSDRPVSIDSLGLNDGLVSF